MRGHLISTRALSLLIAGCGVMWAMSAAAADLPPIGKRRYVIDGQNPYAPVSIKQGRDAQEKAVVLKDPLQPSQHAKVEQIAKKAPVRQAPVKAPVQRASTPGQLRFGKLAVQGHVAQPRVDFTNDTVPLERADEPIYQDFFNKIFAPAEDASF